VVEHATLDWFRALGYDVVGGPDMPPGPHALRESYADTIFPSVVRGALERLNLRRLVRRILRKHGYPPDKQEKATRTVLEQAEVLSAGWAA